jgi:hypothetical protein
MAGLLYEATVKIHTILYKRFQNAYLRNHVTRYPPGVKLFTADALEMYTNMDVDTGLMAFRNLFTTYRDSLPPTFPTEFFLSTLEIVMKSNIFTFSDTYWLQLQETSMGTPAAPLYYPLLHLACTKIHKF